MFSRDINIIVDTREQKPIDFDIEPKLKSGYVSRIVGIKRQTLETGDYTIEGYENSLIIERKSGLCELFENYSPVEHKKRIEREFERMADIKHKYLIVESSLDADVLKMSIQQYQYPIPASKIVTWIMDMSMKYNIYPMFVGNASKRVLRSIFDLIVRKYTNVE